MARTLRTGACLKQKRAICNLSGATTPTDAKLMRVSSEASEQKPKSSWLLSTRPSTGPYPTANGTDRLYRLLRELRPDGAALSTLHVLDFVKFRGKGGDRGKNRYMNRLMWFTSFQVLQAEFDLLDPPRIFIMEPCYQWLVEWLVDGWLSLLRSDQSQKIAPLLRELKARSQRIQSWYVGDETARLAEWKRKILT